MGVEWCNSRRGHTNLIEEKTLALSNPQPPTFKSNAMFTTKGFANNKDDVNSAWVFEYYLTLPERLTGQDIKIKSVFNPNERTASM